MKLELNVKRFNNEDVIATSGQSQVCNLHAEEKHIFTTSDVYQGEYYAMYINANKYDAGCVTSSGNISAQIGFYFDETPVKDQWYYWDSNTNKYKVCTGNHDGYTN